MKKGLNEIQQKINELKRQERSLNIVDVLQDLLDAVREIDARVPKTVKRSARIQENFNDGTYF